ncbi:PP2C family protein-serine/threonine phosphatase, partial [Streptomyces anulatus]|uniref:PP2C family protein-serine/threonine phosphatase n=1 Tax=Streptomyces anulatus TaxID=1892 RepID=UPI0034372950
MVFTVDAAARTHIGLLRRRNEDAVYAGRFLFVVADGLGGHPAGDVAASTVIEAVRPYDHQVAAEDLPQVLGWAIYAASRALRAKVEADPGLAGMGSTLVAMLWSGTRAVVANVGDSRAYLLPAPPDDGLTVENTPIVRITEDHIYRNLVADADGVPNLPGRISRFLDGRPEGRSPDLTIRQVRRGDRFLLCSDGLSSAVPGELIQEALSSPADPRQVTDRLVALALDHGGPDNITVIVVDVGT